ncbi:HNH endonuclease signature motif containing protein [Actinotalea fermentans]|uniref:HNH endonuclease n=1 Tax=Actinotalea fermentans TaxID=43671 RepID=A0A511YWK2_9CELL|nr:HNH endonuclease signature motif containing protein [Actinotalea fermentans]GEN79549.1 HNH endonuclease [Actinotalea fermentans]
MERVEQSLAVALRDVVDRLVVVIEEAPARPAGPPEEATELVLALCREAGRLQVAAARLSTTAADDGLWAATGARSFPHWLAGAAGMSVTRARELVATGRALRDHLPATAAAALAGEVSAEQARTMATLAPTTPARQAALAAPADACGEEFLVEHARESSVEGFRRLVRRWAAAADPDADERGYRDACDREFLALSSTLGGYHLAGFLTTEHGATFAAALESAMTPPAPDDARTTQQRRAQAVADVSRLVLDNGLVGRGAAVRPHLNVVVDFDTLRRAVGDGPGRDRGSGEPCRASGEQGSVSAQPGHAPAEQGDRPLRLAPVADVERFAVAEVLGAGPIPAVVLARLACDTRLSRVVFGPESQVINAGRAERTFSGPRRAAVLARDGTCRYPGCTAPPALGEIHHVDEWVADRGDTDANTGILLCWHHHDVVHRLHVDIQRSPTGGWTFRTRHGAPVAAAA